MNIVRKTDRWMKRQPTRTDSLTDCPTINRQTDTDRHRQTDKHIH